MDKADWPGSGKSMRIDVSRAAADKLALLMSDGDGMIKIVWDTDGCGCAVSGVVQLWLVDEAGESDIAVKCDGPVRFLIDSHQTVFFEDVLKLDCNASRHDFILKSDSQIYHHALTVADRRRVCRT